MREISLSDITNTVKRLCLEANITLRPDVLAAVESAIKIETSAIGRDVLEQVIKNAEIAKAEKLPICQDTGYVGVFIELGQNIVLLDDMNRNSISAGYDSSYNDSLSDNLNSSQCGESSGDGLINNLNTAVAEGVRQAYSEGSFRKSIVRYPIFDRINTGNNTPAFVHVDLIDGEVLKITVMPKGGGTENVSQLRMLPVSGDVAAVRQFVLEAAENAAKSCPPVIIGVGIGGSFDKVGLLAKKALMRPLEKENLDPKFAALERELLAAVNRLGIGPAGLGGNVTALGVKIETAPTHIACLPAAVAFNCIAARQAEAVL